MSTFYRKDNNEGAMALYLKSQIYRGDMVDIEYTNLRNFQIAESLLYGRVNRNYVSIEPSPTVAFEQLAAATIPGTTHRVFKFVAAAFKDLQQQFRIKGMSGHIRSDDPILSTLEIEKAYESPRTFYDRFIAGRRENFISQLRTSNINFRNFDEFLIHLLPVMEEGVAALPFTYPAFIRSSYCPPTTSGLVIEIADLDASNDEEKITKFKNSPNWEFYLNACRSYGFYVDAANPARLVANIGSSEMVKYAQETSKCNYLSTDDILFSAYQAAHVSYYEGFIQNILFFYNQAKRPYMEMEYCQNGKVSTTGGSTSRSYARVITPVEYTEADLRRNYGEVFFLELYLKIRLMEERETGLTPYDKERLVRDTVRMAKLKTPRYAIDYFEAFIGRTYDYSGSLTDLLYRATIRREEEINVLSNT